MPRLPTPPGEDNPGVLSVAWPILVPSELRHCFMSACAEASAEVRLKDGKGPPARAPFYFANTASERQRRRKTWTWRRQRNHLPDDAQVDIVLHAARRLVRLFTSPQLLAVAAA